MCERICIYLMTYLLYFMWLFINILKIINLFSNYFNYDIIKNLIIKKI